MGRRPLLVFFSTCFSDWDGIRKSLIGPDLFSKKKEKRKKRHTSNLIKPSVHPTRTHLSCHAAQLGSGKPFFLFFFKQSKPFLFFFSTWFSKSRTVGFPPFFFPICDLGYEVETARLLPSFSSFHLCLRLVLWLFLPVYPSSPPCHPPAPPSVLDSDWSQRWKLVETITYSQKQRGLFSGRVAAASGVNQQLQRSEWTIQRER